MAVKVVCPQIRSQSPCASSTQLQNDDHTYPKISDAVAIDAIPRLEFLAIASMHLNETELQVKVGMTVTHKSYGAGKVVGEWHSIRSGVPCKDIFDVSFQNPSGCPFLHCCRKEYLTPDPLFFTLGE
jgi:hypothetical protein